MNPTNPTGGNPQTPPSQPSDSGQTQAPVYTHPRDVLCDNAGKEMVQFVEAWGARHQLTSIEFLYILNQIEARHLILRGMEERQLMVQGKLNPVPGK